MELYSVIKKWNQKVPTYFKTIVLNENVGLANTLNEGLKVCNTPFIARMATDDISMPDRFQKQIEFLERNKEIDVVRTLISEIDEETVIINPLVKYPFTNKELYNFFKKTDPVAHSTTMFRKSYFKKDGNYKADLHLAEDTLLWYDGFMNGCIFANLNYVGLKYRRTLDFHRRRANRKKIFELFNYRVKVINKNLDYGFVADTYVFVYFCILIAPSFVKKIAYQIFR